MKTNYIPVLRKNEDKHGLKKSPLFIEFAVSKEVNDRSTDRCSGGRNGGLRWMNMMVIWN